MTQCNHPAEHLTPFGLRILVPELFPRFMKLPDHGAPVMAKATAVGSREFIFRWARRDSEGKRQPSWMRPKKDSENG